MILSSNLQGATDTTAVVNGHNMKHGGSGVVVETTKISEAATVGWSLV